MWVVTKKTLREFWERRPDAEQPLIDWCQAVERADWTAPHQVTARFASASVLRNDRVVFNIKGNTYRLVVHIRYQHHKVFIRFIGMHAEYDSINAEEV